jgi:hypothetical protein
MTPPVRAALALGTVLLLLLGAAAPHAHGGDLGTHGCVACVAAAGEEAVAATPAVAPRFVPARPVPPPWQGPPSAGAPLGAVPGQSPPTA